MADRTREGWLNDAVASLAGLFEPYGKPVPDTLLVSIGYAKRPGKGIGWCYKAEVGEDNHTTIFISPELTSEQPVRLLGVLLHEMIHAADNGESGHKGWFASTAKALGLTGKMTATTVGPDLENALHELSTKLGPLPHKTLNISAAAKGKVGAQKNRQIKIECPDDGYKLRGSRQQLDLAIPDCPLCGGPMAREDN